MTLRTLLVATGLALVVPACASAQHDDAGPSAGSASALDYSAVVLQGSLGKGESITLSYAPADEPGANATVPFIGTTLSAKVSAISVTGDFPGEPEVRVLDGDGNVVAAAKGVRSATGVQASVAIPAEADAREVLVKDDIWVRPMPFTLAAQ